MTVNNNKNICDNEEYELVPPEGGWGYMICIGLSVIFVSKCNFKY